MECRKAQVVKEQLPRYFHWGGALQALSPNAPPKQKSKVYKTH